MRRRQLCRGSALVLILVCFDIAVCPVNGVHFYINPGTHRCFTEDLPMGKRVSGQLSVAAGKGTMDLDLWITTLDGKVLYHQRSESLGHFTFNTPVVQSKQYSGVDDDEYDPANGHDDETIRFCVEHRKEANAHEPEGTRRLVSFSIQDNPNGQFAKSARTYAKEEHSQFLQESLQRAQETLAGLISDMAVLQQRERGLVERMQLTNNRVAAYAIVSIVFAGFTSLVQLQYFKGYFKEKRLC